LAAVKQNGMALYDVLEQTDEIALEAVKQNGLALQYVVEQTEEICMAAVLSNPFALEHVLKKFQTNAIVYAALTHNKYAEQFVK
jgi:hypothetical protein